MAAAGGPSSRVVHPGIKKHAAARHCPVVEGLTGIVYLVAPSQLWLGKDNNVYKVGRSNALSLVRLKAYGPDPAPHVVLSVRDAPATESRLLKEFAKRFEPVPAAGREYFRGSIIEMRQVFVCIALDIPIVPFPSSRQMAAPPAPPGGPSGHAPGAGAAHGEEEEKGWLQALSTGFSSLWTSSS